MADGVWPDKVYSGRFWRSPGPDPFLYYVFLGIHLRGGSMAREQPQTHTPLDQFVVQSKQQYLLTFQVSRYCCMRLPSGTHSHVNRQASLLQKSFFSIFTFHTNILHCGSDTLQNLTNKENAYVQFCK